MNERCGVCLGFAGVDLLVDLCVLLAGGGLTVGLGWGGWVGIIVGQGRRVSLLE